jgi:hypothetical protein
MDNTPVIEEIHYKEAHSPAEKHVRGDLNFKTKSQKQTSAYVYYTRVSAI